MPPTPTGNAADYAKLLNQPSSMFGTLDPIFGIDPVSAALSSALDYVFGIPSRNEAERAKLRAIEQATVNAMTAEGKNPYETYNVGMFDTSQYADLAGIPTIGTPEEMLRQTVSTVVDAYRKENPEKVEEEFEKIITGQPSVTEEIVDVNASTIDDTTTTLEEDTLADIIGRWIGKQTGPVTQERILEKIGELGYTGEDFNAAVEGSNIPSLENFVTERDLAGSDKDNGGNGGTEGGDGGNGDGVDKDTPTPTPTTPKPTPTPDLNEPVQEQPTILPQLPLTQEVTQEPESTTGMLFAALSPTRTTSEVLAPDLFKLDKNIPLVGRLTQNTPMAAPQYLLSGISQRYRV